MTYKEFDVVLDAACHAVAQAMGIKLSDNTTFADELNEALSAILRDVIDVSDGDDT